MTSLKVENLLFNFPENWQPLPQKYDDSVFYRNQFTKQQDGIKAVDLVAISPEKTAYLIEVKDYRHPETTKPSALSQALTNKVLNTLAALLPTRLNASIETEKQLATAILECNSLRVVFHIEQPKAHHPKVDLADLKQKLKRSLKAIDPHFKIVSADKMQSLPWTVM